MRTVLHLFRHGQTDWNLTTQHTGHTDLPLNEAGRAEARQLGERIRAQRFDRVLCSSLSRARETCALAGHAAHAEYTDDLREWHYGSWEGRTRAEIVSLFPGWNMWTQGAPDGESPDDLVARVDRVLAGLGGDGGTIALFAHGHVLRVVACRWLGWPLAQGPALRLSNCAECVLVRDDDGAGMLVWNRGL
jgi:probable phosphoglycerate mutase